MTTAPPSARARAPLPHFPYAPLPDRSHAPAWERSLDAPASGSFKTRNQSQAPQLVAGISWSFGPMLHFY